MRLSHIIIRVFSTLATASAWYPAYMGVMIECNHDCLAYCSGKTDELPTCEDKRWQCDRDPRVADGMCYLKGDCPDNGSLWGDNCPDSDDIGGDD